MAFISTILHDSLVTFYLPGTARAAPEVCQHRAEYHRYDGSQLKTSIVGIPFAHVATVTFHSPRPRAISRTLLKKHPCKPPPSTPKCSDEGR